MGPGIRAEKNMAVTVGTFSGNLDVKKRKEWWKQT